MNTTVAPSQKIELKNCNDLNQMYEYCTSILVKFYFKITIWSTTIKYKYIDATAE